MSQSTSILKRFSLGGRVAVVTGGNRGLGLAMATGLAEVGAKVVVSGRSPEKTREAAEAISESTGQETLAFVGDVTVDEEVKSLFEETMQRFGRLDILVNNAGINIRRPVDAFPPSEWRQVMETNLVAPFLCCHYAVPHMKANGWGRIINMGSMMGTITLPERTAYSASKAGIHLMTKSLALELAPYGITVNAIAPGPFLTEINQVVMENPELSRFFTDRIPLGRFGDPDEVVGAAVYLASDAASFVTGSILSIDGGWTSQ